MALSRHLCREVAFQILFAAEAQNKSEDLDFVVQETESYISELYKEPSIPSFLEEILYGILNYTPHIREILVTYAPEWPLEKVNPVDRVILLIGIYEIIFATQVPGVVAIDEAIELGKKFGNENSGKFVNGVLNTVMQHKETILNK